MQILFEWALHPVFLRQSLRRHGWLAPTLALVLASLGCTSAPRAAPPAPTPDSHLSLGEIRTTPRPDETGAPVDCNVPISNGSGRTVASLVLACVLLDADGRPIGTGLGTLENLPSGETRRVRSVVYGVRAFETSRAEVTSVTFR